MNKSTTEKTLESLGYIGSGSYYLKEIPSSPLVAIVKIDVSSPSDIIDAYVRLNKIVHVKDLNDLADLNDKYGKALELLQQDLEAVGLNNLRLR